MEWLVLWWDGVELWLVRLPYPLQVMLTLAVLVPLAWSVARGVDRVVDGLSARVTRVREAEPPLGRRDVPGSRAERRKLEMGERSAP